MMIETFIIAFAVSFAMVLVCYSAIVINDKEDDDRK